ncbi:MAG: DUF58 domain-containing protein [Hyphomicrobiales bacterium]
MSKIADISAIAASEPTARNLSALMPDLILSARQIAQTLAHGRHGRKRAGPGESFWQFRPYQNFESMTSIDWRRSASTDQLFVREKEWDTAHTFWLWIDLSPSMWFKSKLSNVTKAERAIVLGLALAEMLVRSGERVGVLGLMRPRTNQDIVPRIAERLIYSQTHEELKTGLPKNEDISRYSEVILISDFLDELENLTSGLQKIGGHQVGGTAVQIIDPAEESFPFSGRVEFKDVQSQERVLIENAGDLRLRYKEAFQKRKSDLAGVCRRLNWGHLIHHTDRSARSGLLNIHGFLSSHYYSTGAMTHDAVVDSSLIVPNDPSLVSSDDKNDKTFDKPVKGETA